MQTRGKCKGKHHCDEMDWHLRVKRIMKKDKYTLTLTGNSFDEEVTLTYCLFCGGKLTEEN